MSAWLLAWPTRSGVRGSRASATPKRGTKFIPTQGHLWSSPRVDESPRSVGVQAGRARVRQDSVGSASGWLGLWRGRTSAPGRGAAGKRPGVRAGAENARCLPPAGRLRLGGGQRPGRASGGARASRTDELARGGRPLRRAGGDWRRRQRRRAELPPSMARRGGGSGGGGRSPARSARSQPRAERAGDAEGPGLIQPGRTAPKVGPRRREPPAPR